MESTDGKKSLFYAPCFIERTSTLRKHPRIVGGATSILKFIYQTEIIDYEWYPQNPLERSKLEAFFDWHNSNKDKDGFLSSMDNLQKFETYFLTTIHPYIGGFADMTICDVTAFFAFMPIWRNVLESQDMRDKFPRMTRWADKMSETEDLVSFLSEVKVKSVAKL